MGYFFGCCVYYEWHWKTRHIPRFPCRLCPLPGPSCLGTHWRIKQYVYVFQNAEDLFQPQRRLNNYFEHDFVQSLDYPTAICISEDEKEKGDIEQQHELYFQELQPPPSKTLGDG